MLIADRGLNRHLVQLQLRPPVEVIIQTSPSLHVVVGKYGPFREWFPTVEIMETAMYITFSVPRTLP